MKKLLRVMIPVFVALIAVFAMTGTALAKVDPPSTYTVTVDVAPLIGGSAYDTPGGHYEAGAQVTLHANPASGWNFDHWTGVSGILKDGYHDTDEPTKIVMPSHNVTVTACFVSELPDGTATATVDPGHVETVINGDNSVTASGTVIVTATASVNGGSHDAYANAWSSGWYSVGGVKTYIEPSDDYLSNDSHDTGKDSSADASYSYVWEQTFTTPGTYHVRQGGDAKAEWYKSSHNKGSAGPVTEQSALKTFTVSAPPAVGGSTASVSYDEITTVVNPPRDPGVFYVSDKVTASGGVHIDCVAHAEGDGTITATATSDAYFRSLDRVTF